MADVQSMLSSVIGAGKNAVHKVGADEIRRFIEQQPEHRWRSRRDGDRRRR